MSSIASPISLWKLWHLAYIHQNKLFCPVVINNKEILLTYSDRYVSHANNLHWLALTLLVLLSLELRGMEPSLPGTLSPQTAKRNGKPHIGSYSLCISPLTPLHAHLIGQSKSKFSIVGTWKHSSRGTLNKGKYWYLISQQTVTLTSHFLHSITLNKFRHYSNSHSQVTSYIMVLVSQRSSSPISSHKLLTPYSRRDRNTSLNGPLVDMLLKAQDASSSAWKWVRTFSVLS